MESRYGKANRVWAMDRGMLSEANIKFLQEGDRRYIIGTPKSMLKQFERELLEERLGIRFARAWKSSSAHHRRVNKRHLFLCRSRDRLAEREGDLCSVRNTHRGRIEQDPSQL